MVVYENIKNLCIKFGGAIISGGALPLIFCRHVHFGTYLLEVIFTLNT